MTINVITGDCLEVLPTLAADSVHACVTDPPYGIGFMGRKWDTFKPGVAEQRIVSSGKIVSDNPNLNGRNRSPASSPASVEYDRSISAQREFQAWTEAWAREVYRVLKPGAHLLVCGAPRSYHRMASGIEDAGFEIRDCLMWVFGSGFPKSRNLKGDWTGWGTALKPAWEPIIVARKPLIGTVAENVVAHGCGALNIDGCRVDVNGEPPNARTGGDLSNSVAALEGGDRIRTDYSASPQGRWPANVVHDGSDEVLAAFPDAPGQLADISATAPSPKTSNVYGRMNREGEASVDRRYTEVGATNFAALPGARRLDAGSAARFFYCAKASRADRDEGLEGLSKKPILWSSGTQNPGSFQSPNTDRSARNNHPTVKPTALMRWLCRLVTPPDGVVLDPFTGSGSTGRGAIREGFSFIGIEREAEYVEIAKLRIHADAPLFAEVTT